jgi:hypothetical protein
LLGSATPGRLGNRLYVAGVLGSWFKPESGRELFSISVDQLLDTTPPNISCPPPTTIAHAPGALSVTLNYPPVTATDDRTASPEVSVDYAPGSQYQFSSSSQATLVFGASATDLAGNAASCSVHITFVTEPPDAGSADAGAPPAPDAGAPTEMKPTVAPCGCGLTNSAGGWWCAVLLGVFVLRRRASFLR